MGMSRAQVCAEKAETCNLYAMSCTLRAAAFLAWDKLMQNYKFGVSLKNSGKRNFGRSTAIKPLSSLFEQAKNLLELAGCFA